MVKKCPSCGYNNRDDAAFCSSCGASISGATSPTGPALKPVPSVRVVTPVSPGGPVRVPSPGQCFYHPNLPAVYVCNRCGRSICRDDSKAYMDLVLCPQCYMEWCQWRLHNHNPLHQPMLHQPTLRHLVPHPCHPCNRITDLCWLSTHTQCKLLRHELSGDSYFL